jgi:hypothetical protein
MAENPFADLVPGAKTTPRRAPTRSDVSSAQLRATEASTASSRISQAVAGANLKQAPIDTARAATALSFESAVKDARIRKELAEAETADLALAAAKVKKRYPELSATQSTAAARYILMDRGESVYQQAVKKGYEPTDMRNRLASMARGIPMFGANLADVIADPNAELAELGKQSYTEGALRTVTGAAAPGDERPTTAKQYFPTEWQSKNETLRRELAETRRAQRESMKAIAGPAVGGGAAEVPSGKPTLEQFLKAARPANPGASVESLTAYYKKKYGAN